MSTTVNVPRLVLFAADGLKFSVAVTTTFDGSLTSMYMRTPGTVGLSDFFGV